MHKYGSYTHTHTKGKQKQNKTSVIADYTRYYHLKAELIPIGHLLALLGAHHILHVGTIKVKILSDSKN